MGWLGDNAVGLLNFGTSLMNYGLQKKNFDYQKSLQKEIFAREDTSVQRRMADLQAAGLNPNLAAGSGAGAGSVVSTSAPQLGGADIGNKIDAQIHEQQLEQQKAITKQERRNANMAQKQDELMALTYARERALNNFLFNDYGQDFEQPIYRQYMLDLQNYENQAEILKKQNNWFNTQQIEGLINTGVNAFTGIGNGFNSWNKYGKNLNGNLPNKRR